MAKTALFVIDIQDELARDPKTRIPAGDRVVDAATTLLDRARSRVNEARSKSEDSNLALIFVQHEESDEGGTLMKGTKPWELVFKPRDGEGHERLVPKQHP